MTYCSSCGAKVITTQTDQPAQSEAAYQNYQQANKSVVIAPKSKSAAALLAIFLGGLGMHHFYLERPLLGLFYLLFFWTFIPALIALLEGLSYLMMSDAAFTDKYCIKA